MNQDRRAKIEALVDEAKAQLEALQSAVNELRELQEEEQECFDNLPEGLQQADRGQTMEAIANDLDSAVGSLESACSDADSALDDVLSALDN